LPRFFFWDGTVEQVQQIDLEFQPEAVQLILQAAPLGQGGEIFLLEMGKPVKLMELAEKMIRLLGYTPHETMEIKITGIRPGEKLYEELVDVGEEVQPTIHKKINRLKPNTQPTDDFIKKMERLYESLPNLDNESMKTRLFDFIATECVDQADPVKAHK